MEVVKQLLNRRPGWIGCLVAIALAGAPGEAAAQGHFGRGTLNDRMTWEEITQAMAKYPPSFDSGLERMFIMQSMDRLVDFQVQKMGPKERARLTEMVHFYRRRVDSGLDALEKTRSADAVAGAKARPGAARRGPKPNTRRPENVRVVKFYSSSVVLCTPSATVAIDFAQGPVDNHGEPEVSDPYGTGFYLSPRQRDHLSHLVDVLLITHCHHDHADYSLAKRLVAQGKPVFGPADLKTYWPELAKGITVPEYDKVEQAGPCEIFTQLGAQYVKGAPGEDGPAPGTAESQRLDKDVQSVRYLIRLGGIVFLHSAENHADADQWLARAHRLGWRVDVVFSTGQYQGVTWVPRYLVERGYFHIPVHEYDLEHEASGNRTAVYFMGKNLQRYMSQKLMPLMWGENFLLTPQLARPPK